MLNLIYYDLKATIKKLWGYLVLICVFAFFVRFLWSDAFMSAFGNTDFYIGSIIKFAAAGFLGALGFLTAIVTIVRQAQWFDENILSPQGQLTNMLPVSRLEIVLSKIIVSLFWSIIIVLMAIGVASVVMVQTKIFETFVKAITEVSINNNIHISMPRLLLSLGFCIATVITSIVTLCFLSQMIGQMSNSFRNLIILLSFVAIFALSLALQYLAARLLGITVPSDADPNQLIAFAIASTTKCTVINICTIVVYWLATSYILRHHLNLL